MKNIYFIIVALVVLFYVINSVKKGNLSIKESFFWVAGAMIALVLAIFPKMFDQIAKFVGITYAPSLFFLLCIIFLLLINFRNSKKIAIQQEKIIELAQNVALLKDKQKERENDE